MVCSRAALNYFSDLQSGCTRRSSQPDCIEFFFGLQSGCTKHCSQQGCIKYGLQPGFFRFAAGLHQTQFAARFFFLVCSRVALDTWFTAGLHQILFRFAAGLHQTRFTAGLHQVRFAAELFPICSRTAPDTVCSRVAPSVFPLALSMRLIGYNISSSDRPDRLPLV
jgi:hypothetical protein